MSDQELRDELMTLLVAGHETTATSLGWAFERLAREPAVLDRLVAEVDSGDEDVPDRDDPGDAAAPAGAAEHRPAAGQEADRGRRLALRAGRLPGRQRLSRPPRPRDLPRPLRVPARAVHRQAARHLHLDPVRRRAAALPRGELRDARDEGRAARGALRATRSGRLPTDTSAPAGATSRFDPPTERGSRSPPGRASGR